ncbi:5-oxoprolinase subunit PxpB [Nocardioides sp. ChNu-153]|uniref:5-oxoprolinase subunit PxpB n=1 Tax=Nocardioides sp. ChNu-153 TaxID=2779364 RepID=UPI002650A504|nr:5-oxoprolinase subunit PxpB [Nocardioides sp. ChNu-153]MDN7120664.1 5-oxoprolinase subunit PxpB [Nocardioides sp. ChNu-153]
MSTARLLPYGDRAVLVEVEDTPAVVRLVDALAVAGATGPEGPVAEVVPAARTVLLVARPGVPVAAVRAAAERTAAEQGDRAGDEAGASTGAPEAALDAGTIEIPVVYDGPDLAEVAALTGLSEREVVAAHTGRPWRVAFGGFAPGFAYLVGGDPRLHVPRRSEPRTSVPAGAVGLAGEFSGVYPRSSPGGWQLLGRTDLVLWDLDREPPALLRPGAAVRFTEAT